MEIYRSRKRVPVQSKNARTLAVVLVLALLAAIPLISAATDSRNSLRVTYNPIPFNAPTILMHRGMLQDRMDALGIQVEWISGLLKGSLMTESMASGELDIASVMGGTSAVVSYAGGRDIVIVGGYSRAPQGFGIVVRPDSPIETVADLKGKTVVGPVGTEVHFLLARALEEAGLSLRDIELRNDLVPNAISYVINGSADAALAVEPMMSVYEHQGKVRVLRTGEGLMPGATFVAVRGSFLRDRPDVVVQYLRAQIEAIQDIESMGDEVLALAADELDMPQPVIERVAQKYTFSAELDSQAIADLKNVADFLFQEGLIRNKVDVRSMVDTSLLEEALSSEGR